MLPLEITECHEQVLNLRVQITIFVLGHGGFRPRFLRLG